MIARLIRRGSTRSGHPRALALLLAVAAAVVLAAATGVARASAGNVQFGVADDAAKYANDGGSAVYSDLNDVHMSQNRWVSVYTGSPTNSEKAFFSKAAPKAKAAGISVTVTVYPHPASLSLADSFPTDFCNYVKQLAQDNPTITRFIIGNEVNKGSFWGTPQDSGSATRYYNTLKTCYSTLKGVNQNITVIGFGLSATNGGPSDVTPLSFLKAVGAAFKADPSPAKFMDEIAVHPYPNQQDKTPNPPATATYDNPESYGATQLSRVKQALYDAFHGSAQPDTTGGLKLVVDEIGYQTVPPSDKASLYSGSEQAPVVSLDQQATYHSDLVKLLACDPEIDSVLFFQLIDENSLGGWQSGLEYADGSHKPSYDAVKAAIATGCASMNAPWAPAGATTPPPTGGTFPWSCKPKPTTLNKMLAIYYYPTLPGKLTPAQLAAQGWVAPDRAGACPATRYVPKGSATLTQLCQPIYKSGAVTYKLEKKQLSRTDDQVAKLLATGWVLPVNGACPAGPTAPPATSAVTAGTTTTPAGNVTVCAPKPALDKSTSTYVLAYYPVSAKDSPDLADKLFSKGQVKANAAGACPAPTTIPAPPKSNALVSLCKPKVSKGKRTYVTAQINAGKAALLKFSAGYVEPTAGGSCPAAP